MKPILIVGAGPCGLTAAVYLTHYGIPVRIIDKKIGPTKTSNAVGVQARTLELLEEVGLASLFKDAGRICTEGAIFHQKKSIAHIELGNHIKSLYNYICMLPQCSTESILIEFLTKKKITVEYNTELTQLVNKKDYVDTTIIKGDDSASESYQFLISADGYNSFVRTQLAIPYSGADYSYKFIMIDSPILPCKQLEKQMVIAAGDKVNMLIFPMQASCRFIAEISQSTEYNVKHDYHTFNDLAKELLPFDISIQPETWSSTFYVHERLAKSYRKNTIFLLGDAVHSHIPAGAQGMNTGMQDAINLSWKIARVIKNSSAIGILDSYELERRQVAQHVLRLTNRMGKTLLSKNILVRTFVTAIASILSRLNNVQKLFSNTLAQLDIHYTSSSLSMGKKSGNISPGHRLSNIPVVAAYEKYILLDGIGDIPLVWGQSYSIIVITHIEHYPWAKNKYCLIRPDRYIAYLGGRKSDVLTYFKCSTSSQ